MDLLCINKKSLKDDLLENDSYVGSGKDKGNEVQLNDSKDNIVNNTNK